MGQFLTTEKKRYAIWKTHTGFLTDAARNSGMYKGGTSRYPFCLEEDHSHENLYPQIRRQAIDYFAANKIPWHDGHAGMPSTHLCDSQVCCVNFLFPFMHNPEALVALLKPLFPGIKSVLPMEERQSPSYLSFEWIGFVDYLGESKRKKNHRTRGANATSADAAVMFENLDSKRHIALIEWKYTESYGENSKAIPARLNTYKKFWWDGPLNTRIIPDFNDLFYEPFYQLMRQQFLAHEMEKAHELGAETVSVLHVAPGINRDFQKVSSPGLRGLGDSVIGVWKEAVADPATFASVSTEQLFSSFPVTHFPELEEWWGYMEERYSWIRPIS